MFGLLKRLSFSSVTIAQFLGALNDNALRQTYLLLVVGMGTAERQAEATVLFALPFLIFSPLAGQLADRFSKRKVFIVTKFIELLVMCLSAYALWHNSLGLLLLSILLMASQSAFFSPAKYGILPEILQYEQLSHGNGIIQMTTNVAILFGTALAGFLLEQGGGIWTGFTLVFFGFIGWSITFLIEKVPPASEELEFDFNPFKRLAQNLNWIRHDSLMLLAVVGFVCSWLLGTVLTLNVNVFGLQTLGVGETLTSLLFVALALGLGTGNTLSGWLSGKKIEYGLIFPGLAGFAFCLLAIWSRLGGFYFSYLWMFLTGVFSGLFLIPLQSALQDRPPKKQKGEGLATANILTFTGVIAGTAIYVLLVQHVGVSALSLMLCLGAGGFVFAFLLLLIMPWLFRRFVIWILSVLFFKIKVSNEQFIPHRGPVLIPTGSVDLVGLLKLAYCIPLPLLVSGEIQGEVEGGSPLAGLLFSRIGATDKLAAENLLTEKIENNASASSALCLSGIDFNDISTDWQNKEIEIIKASVTDISTPEDVFRSLLIRVFGSIARPVRIKFFSPAD